MIFNMLFRQDRSVLAQIMTLLLITLVLAGCRERWVSSPEGTATTYVQNAGMIVYAPRSARVQKVVFDTADNQLIQEPDTPFRTFFNAHAADFSRGNLEYAKTTILGDIVNLVENREFIREMIVETVARHKSRAIRSQSDPSIVKQRALSAIETLEGTAAIVELKLQDLQPLIEKANDAVKKYRAASAFYENLKPEGSTPTAAVPDADKSGGGEGDRTVTKVPLGKPTIEGEARFQEGGPRFQSDLSILVIGNGNQNEEEVKMVASWGALEQFIDAYKLSSSHGSLQELRSLVRTLAGDLRTLVAKFPGETGSASAVINQTDNNAALLVNALFNALNEAKYPDMRPNEIDAVLSQFLPDEGYTQTDSVPGHKNTKRRETWQRLVIDSQAGKDLKEDLLLTLKEQRYFSAVIDKAVDKRRNLFQGATPLTATLGSAQNTVTAFLTNNVGARYLADIKTGTASLWNAFLARENREKTTAESGSLIAPATTRIMTDVELAAFGKELRSELLAAIQNGATLRDAVTVAAAARTQYLRATTTGKNETDIAARTGAWTQALLDEQRMLDAFDQFKDAATTLKAKADANRSLPQAAKDEAANFENIVKQKHPSFLSAESATGDLKLGYNAFAESKADASTSGTSATADVVANPKAFPLYDIVKAMADLAEDAESCASNETDCPRNKVHVKNLVFEIQQLLIGFDTNLSNVSSDQATLTAFEAKVSAYKVATGSKRLELADDTAREIINFPVQLKTVATSVTSTMGNAHQKLEAYATKFITYFTQPDPAHDNRQQIYELANHLKVRTATFKTKVESAAGKLNQKTTIANLKTDMEAVRTAHKAMTDAQTAGSPASGQLDQAKAEYETKKKNFYHVTTTLAAEINPRMPEHQKLSESMLGNVFKRIDLKLRAVGEGAAALSDDLTALLTEGLKIAQPRDIAAARQQFIDSFVATFNGYPGLVASDEPILVAFLKVADIPFSSPANRTSGAASLPKAIAKMCSTSEPDKPTGCGVTLDIKVFASSVSNLMNSPEIALLFGPGQSSNAYINAFKLELYNAFKHRVAEAVRAERKADYDYWWMTFHPKAVPLGENSADGQSVIEISFPRSATPQEQYHRWIQDRIDLEEPDANKRRDADSNKDGKKKPNWRLQIQAATAVLNDFLIVLDTSNLTDKYPGIRSTIVDALNKFAAPITNPKTDFKKHYDHGIGVLLDEVKAEREREKVDETTIMLEVIEGGVDIPGVKAKKIREAVSSLSSKIEALRPVPQIQVEDDLKTALEQLEKENSEQYNSFKDYTSKVMEARENLAKERPWEEYYMSILKQKEARERNSEANSPNGDEGVAAFVEGRQTRNGIRRQVRTDIAWDRFSVKHVLFAVTSAAETGITLPYKIELYTQAYFDGSRRFVDPVPNTDKESAAFVFANLPLIRDKQDIINSGKFVVPFSEKAQDISVKRLLHLSGVNLATLSNDSCGREHIYSSSRKVIERGLPDISKFSENRFTDEYLDYLGRATVDKADKDSSKPASARLTEEQLQQVKNIACGLEYRAGAQPSRYLQDPRLWLWESRLQALREDLRFILVSLFQTSYPGVPDPTRIRDEFSKNDGRLRTLVYEWLRDLWLESARIHQINLGKGPNSDTIPRVKVLINLHLDRHPYLSLPSREQLISLLSKEINIYEWIRIVTRDQKLMDALSKNLLNALYAPLWDALSRLEKIERQPVAYDHLGRTTFERFRHWSKPKVQPGVQIIDLLPASRDDLVSTSINEGGIVARLAAQADASAAYDLNKLRMATEFVDKTSEVVRSLSESNQKKTELTEQNLSQSVSEHQRVEDARRMADVSKISDSLSSFGYNLGARAQASVYARAKAAVAYSKRREYLDAAITASGRGDNFAKWIVRKSDLRSELAETDSEELTAAAHNGYPNGDQPFHLLVKIPHGSVQIDWDGKPYILFNSSYAATGRKSWYKTAGFPGLIAKAPLALINPEWWTAVEQKLLATTYPFKWDVQNPEEQIQLISVPNTLGGRLYLDDTDKVKFSDIRALIEAESAFIKATRSAQTGELKKLMGDISDETQKFRGDIRTRLEQEHLKHRLWQPDGGKQ